jgi:putative transposase
VKRKSRLNRSILDQGWSEFRRQLTYKLEWLGGHLIVVASQYTRTCPACRYASGSNRTTQARFACTECGYENHADVVGAMNVLAAGHAVLACGGPVLSGHSAKQEPAEGAQ